MLAEQQQRRRRRSQECKVTVADDEHGQRKSACPEAPITRNGRLRVHARVITPDASSTRRATLLQLSDFHSFCRRSFRPFFTDTLASSNLLGDEPQPPMGERAMYETEDEDVLADYFEKSASAVRHSFQQ